jgi:hypothetical protein
MRQRIERNLQLFVGRTLYYHMWMVSGGSPTKYLDPKLIGGLFFLPIKPQDVTIDGNRITLDAEEEIVLRCGKAGKVLIRGEYILSRSAGANKIRGGSIQLNELARAMRIGPCFN